MTIRVLAEKGQSNCQIARQLGVVEGTVRYHFRRAEQGTEDGRRDKPELADSVAEVIASWHADRKDEPRLVARWSFSSTCSRSTPTRAPEAVRPAPAAGSSAGRPSPG